MLQTITTTHSPATDLGYLLHKHPARVQTFELSFGEAHVFYPEAGPKRCTAALLLDIDPLQLAQKGHAPPSSEFLLQSYVNDRPYVTSSFLSVTIAEIFGTALSGRCHARPALAATPAASARPFARSGSHAAGLATGSPSAAQIRSPGECHAMQTCAAGQAFWTVAAVARSVAMRCPPTLSATVSVPSPSWTRSGFSASPVQTISNITVRWSQCINQ
jgi:hypothetical protein